MSNKLFICGWYGTETLGDKAILGGIIQALNKTDIEFKQKYLVSLNPYLSKVTKEQMPELFDLTIISIKESYNLLNSKSILIFGGGPLMAIKEISLMSLLFERNRSLNGINVLGGVGLGPFGPRILNKYIKRIVKLADLAIFRDDKSLNEAIKIRGSNNALFLAEDPSLTWITHNTQFIEDRRINNSFQKTVLLCLRDFPFVEYAYELGKSKGKRIKEAFDKNVLNLIDKLLLSDNIIIKPMPMCTNSYGGDDRWYLRNLLGERVFCENIDSSLLNSELSPINYLAEFKHCDLSLAMRFHSVLFSLGTGTKPFVFDYTLGEGKVNSLIKRFDLMNYNLIDKSNIVLGEYLNDTTVNFFEFDELKFERIFSYQLKRILN